MLVTQTASLKLIYESRNMNAHLGNTSYFNISSCHLYREFARRFSWPWRRLITAYITCRWCLIFSTNFSACIVLLRLLVYCLAHFLWSPLLAFLISNVNSIRLCFCALIEDIKTLKGIALSVLFWKPNLALDTWSNIRSRHRKTFESLWALIGDFAPLEQIWRGTIGLCDECHHLKDSNQSSCVLQCIRTLLKGPVFQATLQISNFTVNWEARPRFLVSQMCRLQLWFIEQVLHHWPSLFLSCFTSFISIWHCNLNGINR